MTLDRSARFGQAAEAVVQLAVEARRARRRPPGARRSACNDSGFSEVIAFGAREVGMRAREHGSGDRRAERAGLARAGDLHRAAR